MADHLWRMQFLKCAYCEVQEQRKRNDVEHFRPKGRIDAGGGKLLTPGYWWLAWSWHNLLFSCRNCNQSPAKLDKFPIEAGCPRLAAEDEPPGAEKPLLVDPYLEDPMDHIAFQLSKFDGRDRWGPVARSGSLRGRKTIDILLLDRDDLLDLYEKHVELHLDSEISSVTAAIALGTAQAVQATWRSLVRTTERRRPFSALAHDVIDFHLPSSVRANWGLVLQRP